MIATKAREQLLGWVLQLGEVDYERALEWQHGLVKMRQQGLARDTIIMLQHPPVVTVGRDGHTENFHQLKEVSPYFVERGGDVTYHGPGQLVVYFVFNLSRRGRDLHAFMDNIQQGIIQTLREYGVNAAKGDEHTGIWVGEKKIASIGVAVRHWITYHGAAINLNTRLRGFKKINPCGLDSRVMTSLQRLTHKKVDLTGFTHILLSRYSELFKTEFTPISLEALAEELESQSGGYGV